MTALSIFAAQVFQRRAVFGQNDSSRWATVWSLIHGQGYIIDEAPYATIDKVRLNGHYYSSKPQLLPTVVAGITQVIAASTGWNLPDDEQTLIPVILYCVNILPLMLALYLYGRWLRGLACGDFAKCVSLIAASFGTYVTAYSMSLNNHTVAACAMAFAFHFLEKVINHAAPPRRWFFLCGLCGGWVVANELPAGLFCLFLLFALARVARVGKLAYFVAGVTVIGSLFFLCIYLATGGFVPFYLRHDLYHYPGSYWDKPQGIDAGKDPIYLQLFHYVLGHHGIISLSPIFVWAFAGMFLKATPRFWTIGAVSLTFVNFAFLFITSSNYGGVCQGPRWFFWLIPFWLLFLPHGLEATGRRRGMKVIIIVAVIWSIYSVVFAMVGETAGPWSRSWLHHLMHTAGLVKY